MRTLNSKFFRPEFNIDAIKAVIGGAIMFYLGRASAGDHDAAEALKTSRELLGRMSKDGLTFSEKCEILAGTIRLQTKMLGKLTNRSSMELCAKLMSEEEYQEGLAEAEKIYFEMVEALRQMQNISYEVENFADTFKQGLKKSREYQFAK